MYNEVAATCTNTAGSYKCDCIRPFWDGDGTISMLSTAHGAGISCVAVYGIPPSAPPSVPPPPASPPVPPSPPLPSPPPPANPSCPALSCGPGTVEDPITSKCEISCGEVGRRLSAAEKEKLGERPLALAPREYLEGYLADHPGFAAVVDDELHELLLEVLSDGMALARPNALAELP